MKIFYISELAYPFHFPSKINIKTKAENELELHRKYKLYIEYKIHSIGFLM